MFRKLVAIDRSDSMPPRCAARRVCPGEGFLRRYPAGRRRDHPPDRRCGRGAAQPHQPDRKARAGCLPNIRYIGCAAACIPNRARMWISKTARERALPSMVSATTRPGRGGICHQRAGALPARFWPKRWQKQPVEPHRLQSGNRRPGHLRQMIACGLQALGAVLYYYSRTRKRKRKQGDHLSAAQRAAGNVDAVFACLNKNVICFRRGICAAGNHKMMFNTSIGRAMISPRSKSGWATATTSFSAIPPPPSETGRARCFPTRMSTVLTSPPGVPGRLTTD